MKLNRTNGIIIIIAIGLFIFWWKSLPGPLFSDPNSTVIESSNGSLLGAHIAKDEQWRFPETDTLSPKYKTCLITFEDQHFYRHPGVNPFSLVRATIQNIRNQRVVSGGSTLSMQLIRLSGKGKARTVWQKLAEIFLALRLEFSYSKEKILRLYSSHAPFGGNVVGIDAASWRYFGRKSTNLSWAESATIAVLPNAPSLIYPGKRNELLLQKRNRLLDKLFAKGEIDSITWELAKLETLPERVFPIPQIAPHLLSRGLREFPGEKKRTTIDYELQKRTNNVVLHHLKNLKANKINNAAVLVMNIENGEVLAYVGNSPTNKNNEHGEQVDIVTAPRSSGSILKPFLYAGMLDDGLLLPHTLVPDIPTQIGGFSPKNFNLQYEGAVPASMALSKSLNIPAVRMLREYGTDQFQMLLKKLNFSTVNKASDHYGLSLILGGAEINLWDLAGAYASLGRILHSYEKNDGLSFENDIRPPTFIKQDYNSVETSHPAISAGSIWLTLEALLKVNRPEQEFGWDSYSSSKKIAWKTGTSFGFRDAWAVGINRDYLVAVWAGNADGEGRPGLTGTAAAAPILFDVFDLLPSEAWFTQPIDEMGQIPVCSKSGYRLGNYCEKADTIWVMKKGLNSRACPFHKIVHLDQSEEWQVTSNKVSVNEMVHKSWFVLPTVMEWYYKRKKPFYKSLPPFRNDCLGTNTKKVIDLIYPGKNNQVFIPIQLDGTPGQLILEAAHSSSSSTIYWHLDQVFLGQTNGEHKLAIRPSPGEHLLTLYDDNGNELRKTIHCFLKAVH